MLTYCTYTGWKLQDTNAGVTRCLLILIIFILYTASSMAESITLTPVMDTYVDKAQPTRSYGSSSKLSAVYDPDADLTTTSTTGAGYAGVASFVSQSRETRFGRGPSKDSGFSLRRGSRFKSTSKGREVLLQFDLSQIPSAAKINRAYLMLYSRYDRKFKIDSATRVYANLNPWDEKTVWNTKPSIASLYEDSISVTATNKYFEWDVTNLVQNWIDGSIENFGVTVKSEGGGELYFNSRESSSNKPLLYIEYTLPERVSQNQPPSLALQATPSSGSSPLTVTFESNAYDPDGEITEYRWDFNGDGIIDEITYSNPVSYTYTEPGTYQATVVVVDNAGQEALDSVVIEVISQKETSPTSTPTPTPTPEPTPTPTPTPAPEPTPTPTPNPSFSEPDSGVSDAPIVCVGEVIKTVCASGCDYTTIQAAVNAAQPGWTIQVKNGIYTSGGQDTSVVNIIGKSGTSSNPICLQNYPGHTPIIDPTGSVVTQSLNQKGINIYNSRWWIIEGFEIRHGWEGIKIQPPSTDLSQVSSNITIRNNYVHDNNNVGINPHNATDIYIAYNEITSNGDDTDECTAGNQCHNLYIKTNPKYPGIAQKTTIRGNFIQLSSGGAIHIYDRATDVLIENNLLIVDGKWGIVASMDNSIVRNNTIVLSNPPFPLVSNNEIDYVLIDFRYGASTRSNNKFFNNIIYTNGSNFNGKPVYMIATPDKPEIDTWTVDNNLWYAPENTRWIWKGTVKTDFNSQYKQTTGWDKNGPPIPSDPMFVDFGYHIGTNSPARNEGDNSECALTDIDGDTRPQEYTCDIGADEFKG
jgi:PKD repeat protein